MILKIIQTPRLLLREFILDDFPALREIEGDPEILRYRSRPVIPEEATRQFLQDCLRLQNEPVREKYPWAIVLQSENWLVGQVGITLLPEDELAPGHPAGSEAFLWGSVNRRYWNQGIMSEALPAVIDYGFKQIGLLTIHGRSQVENIGSWRALENAGLRRAALVPASGQGPGFYEYIITRDDFLLK